MRRFWIPLLAVVAIVAFPDAVHACAVCFDASDENREAFLVTTAFLSLLPLGMVAGTGVWLRRRVRERDSDGATDASGQDGSSESSHQA
jgi:hypothetical protein